MGMTMDLALDILKHPTDYFPSEKEDADKFAVDIMNKFQKIKDIVINGDDVHYKLLMQIKEVVKDEND